MEINTICEKILAYKIPKNPGQYEVSDFFDQIGEQLLQLDQISATQGESLTKTLFNFLEKQDPEMDENFTFIHLIEYVGKLNYHAYQKYLFTFTRKNGTISSTLLLNRYLNTVKAEQWQSGIDILKATSRNSNYSEKIRKDALDYLEYQMGRNQLS
jgi:hypothetical protein